MTAYLLSRVHGVPVGSLSGYVLTLVGYFTTAGTICFDPHFAMFFTLKVLIRSYVVYILQDSTQHLEGKLKL